MSAPLYEALKAYAGRDPLRLHMPGHKGRPLSAPEFTPLVPLDVTELGPTGNLYEPGEPFDSAQALWSQVLGGGYCQLLTGGSTQALHSALCLLCPPGSEILLDRDCHRSVFHAMGLLDLRPRYLRRSWLPREGVCGGIRPEELEAALAAGPGTKTVCITSPSYYGILSDIPALARIAHRHGARLLVDGAHGAHLAFFQRDCWGEADAVALSAHKTLPSLGQGAMLLTRGLPPELVRQRCALFGSSSPSYLILASMDLARAYFEEEGLEAYRRTAEEVRRLRGRFPCLGEPLSLDPCRLTLLCREGRTLAGRLEEEGIYCEMADESHVVIICTCQDRPEDFRRLEEALERQEDLLGAGETPAPPPLPPRALSIREALLGSMDFLPPEACEGRIAAGAVAPYPPGIPLAAPGEVLTGEILDYFRQISFFPQTIPVVRASDSPQMGKEA